MTANAYKILEYLKLHNGVTAKEVSENVGIQKRLVDSYFSAAIVGQGLGYRNNDTKPAALTLTTAGLEYNQ